MEEKILNKKYLTTQDLMTLTGFGRDKCLSIMKNIKEEMKKTNMWIPFEKKLCVPTKLVRKKLGI